MLIVLEGPDGAGKTTLLKQLEVALREHQPECITSCNPSTPRDFDDYLFATEERAKDHRLYIQDRVLWISDIIYSTVLDRPCRLDLMKVQSYWKLPQIVIFCNPTGISQKDISQEFKAHKPKEHLEAVQRKHYQLVDKYNDFFEAQKKNFTGFMTYNWKSKDPNESRILVKSIREALACVV